uniref:Uncharacterized protein n=1 Tax=Sinocyclocheilus rhinocerous TaxID=307959 RepID=A0A673FZV4_9TELE
MSDRKAVIKNADMSEEMQQDSVECATQALEKYNIEKDIAAYIKKVNDKYKINFMYFLLNTLLQLLILMNMNESLLIYSLKIYFYLLTLDVMFFCILIKFDLFKKCELLNEIIK